VYYISTEKKGRITRTRLRRGLIFGLFCLAIFESTASARESTGKNTVSTKGKLLYIEGTSDIFANFKARAGHSDIHIESRMGGSIWHEKSSNTVTVYNNENKVFFVQKMDDYMRDLNQDFLPMPIEELKPPTKTTFDGRPAKKYLGYANIGKKGRQCVAEITCIDNQSLDPAAHRIWCSFLGLKRTDFGLPVLLNQKRASVVSCDAKVMKLAQPIWVRVLITTKLKEMPVAPDSFSVKPNWKQARDKAALLFSKDGSLGAHDIDDFFRSNAK